jgi:aspartate aminotransferase-like enzyme
MYGLKVALNMMREEGLENIFARHERNTQATREAVQALGLPLLAGNDVASRAVTAVAPTTVEAEKVRSVMKKQFDISLAGGQNQLKGKIFRIGHLGFVSERDVLTVVSALEEVLRELGHETMTPGAGVAAATRVFAES